MATIVEPKNKRSKAVSLKFSTKSFQCTNMALGFKKSKSYEKLKICLISYKLQRITDWKEL